MLEVRKVSVRFGGHTALADVSLAAAGGAITGLIGPNGAGKTTLFDVVTGLRRPSAGSVSLDERDLGRLAPHRRAQAGLARTFQSLQLFGTLTVRENILLGLPRRSGIARHRRDEVVDELLERLELGHHRDTLAQSLSTGTGRRVELGRALASQPTYLLLDEPASGQSVDETHAFAELLRAVARTGVGIVVVEHDVPLVMSLCDQIHVLDFGRLLASGPPAVVRDDPLVQAAYLGVTKVEA